MYALLWILICSDWSPSRYIDRIGGRNRNKNVIILIREREMVGNYEKKIIIINWLAVHRLTVVAQVLGAQFGDHKCQTRVIFRCLASVTNVITHAIRQVQIFFWYTPYFILNWVDYSVLPICLVSFRSLPTSNHYRRRFCIPEKWLRISIGNVNENKLNNWL